VALSFMPIRYVWQKNTIPKKYALSTTNLLYYSNNEKKAFIFYECIICVSEAKILPQMHSFGLYFLPR
jgi:hypothetical protein